MLLTGNATIRAPDGLARIWFSTEPTDYWPVANTSLWLEWRLWGASPNGYHVTNLLLAHCRLLAHLVGVGEVVDSRRALAALLFAVHPINVESVAWIAQRKNVLALLFFLLAIGWYLNAESDQKPEDLANHRRLNLRWYGLSLAAFVLAMLSKGSVAILPLVLLLITWWRRNQITRRDLLLTAPFFLVAAVLTVVNIWFQSHDLVRTIREAVAIRTFARRCGRGVVLFVESAGARLI